MKRVKKHAQLILRVANLDFLRVKLRARNIQNAVCNYAQAVLYCYLLINSIVNKGGHKSVNKGGHPRESLLFRKSLN